MTRQKQNETWTFAYPFLCSRVRGEGNQSSATVTTITAAITTLVQLRQCHY